MDIILVDNDKQLQKVNQVRAWGARAPGALRERTGIGIRHPKLRDKEKAGEGNRERGRVFVPEDKGQDPIGKLRFIKVKQESLVGRGV